MNVWIIKESFADNGLIEKLQVLEINCVELDNEVDTGLRKK